MNEEDESGALDRVYPCDIRFFRERARDERRRVRHVDTDHARRTHAEMAEHYEMVADLLEVKAGLGRRPFTASLWRVLERLFPH